MRCCFKVAYFHLSSRAFTFNIDKNFFKMISDSTCMVHLTHWFTFIKVDMVKGFSQHYHKWIQKMEWKKDHTEKKNQYINSFFCFALKLRCKLKISSGIWTISASALTVRHVVPPSTFSGWNQRKEKDEQAALLLCSVPFTEPTRYTPSHADLTPVRHQPLLSSAYQIRSSKS